MSGWMEKENEVYTYYVISFSLKGKKKKKPFLCENMDEPERHHAKWSKSVTEGQMFMIPFM